VQELSPIFFIASPALLIAFACVACLIADKNARAALATRRRSLLWCLALPGPAFLLLFYSLVLHMHDRLGEWPQSIGNDGFPLALDVHAAIAFNFFLWFLLFTVFVWPVMMLAALLVSRWRDRLAHVVALGLSFWLCWPLILLAPSGFLYWWWD